MFSNKKCKLYASVCSKGENLLALCQKLGLRTKLSRLPLKWKAFKFDKIFKIASFHNIYNRTEFI